MQQVLLLAREQGTTGKGHFTAASKAHGPSSLPPALHTGPSGARTASHPSWGLPPALGSPGGSLHFPRAPLSPELSLHPACSLSQCSTCSITAAHAP